MRFPRTNPAKVNFEVSAVVIPEESAAEREATIGNPTLAALKATSPEIRPLKAKKTIFKIDPVESAIPITLSTALCRPTSQLMPPMNLRLCKLLRHELLLFS